jgi:hypothetical protein
MPTNEQRKIQSKYFLERPLACHPQFDWRRANSIRPRCVGAERVVLEAAAGGLWPVSLADWLAGNWSRFP